MDDDPIGSIASKRKTEPRHIVSFEDFDDYGRFVGKIAPKRRKIELDESDLIQFRKNRQAKLEQMKKSRQQMKKKRIKYDGKGVEKKFIPYSQNIVYEYYDDPNELVDRLMLLVSSKSAGNSNHDQEVNSIIEELRERNIIH